MNSDKSPLNKSATISNNLDLIFNCVFKGYVAFVSYDKHIYCKLALGKKKAGTPDIYYDFDHFKHLGLNAIRRLFETGVANPEYPQYSLQEIENYCKLYYVFESEDNRNKALASLKTPTIVNIHEVKKTGEVIYLINNVVYAEHFPLEWALTPKSVEFIDENGNPKICIAGPGTSPIHCYNCNSFGLRGVFIGYCANCATDYNFTRGYGFIDHGVEMDAESQQINDNYTKYYKPASETYLLGVDLDKLGYLETHSDNCLSGGPLPSGKDICDDQSDLNPFNEHGDDDDLYVTDNDGSKTSSMRLSKLYPRRAYGVSGYSLSFENKSSLDNPRTPTLVPRAGVLAIPMFQVKYTDEMNPEFIRRKIEEFFSANDFEVTDNNYSFPIGPRADWDHYRVEKRPSYWYAWNANLKTQDQVMKFEFRLYMSNPIVYGKGFKPVTIFLKCNFQGDHDSGYKMIADMNDWIFDRKKTPVIGDTTPAVKPNSWNWAIPARISGATRVGIEGFSKRSGLETTEGGFVGECCKSYPSSDDDEDNQEPYESDEDDKYLRYEDEDRGYDEVFDDSEEYGKEYDDFNGLITKKIK